MSARELRYVIGIDPGLTGALAMLDQAGHLIDIADMPAIDGRITAAALQRWLDHKADVGIELVSSMPGQGVASTFKFGASWGVAHGAFGATGHRIIDVRPQDWKKRFRLGPDKDKARRLAAERWPEAATHFVRKKDAGRAEACLIAEHVRQLLAIERGHPTQPTDTEVTP